MVGMRILASCNPVRCPGDRVGAGSARPGGTAAPGCAAEAACAAMAAGWPAPSAAGRSEPRTPEQGRPGCARELDDHAVQVFEVVGVAAADRQQRPAVAPLVTGVQGQQRRHVRVRAVVRVQQLEAIDAERLRQRLRVAVAPARSRTYRRAARSRRLPAHAPPHRPARSERNLGGGALGKGGSSRKSSRCLNARIVSSTPQIGWTRLVGMRSLPAQRPLERLGVVVVGDPHDVDLAVAVGVVQDLLDRRRAVTEGGVDVEDRLPHVAARQRAGARSWPT